jgi:hypothetical protein
MDRRGKFNNIQTALLAMLEGWQAAIWTALPVVVQSFDPVKMTAVVLPASQVRVLDSKGNYRFVTITVISDCPVIFPGGGGYTMTFPIAAGDEGLLIFASRCIDGWWQSGCPVNGPAAVPPEIRMHDMSDGFLLAGPRSQPRVLAGISTDTAQLRSDDGDVYVELAAGHVVNIVAPGGVNITGNLHCTGAVIAGYGGADQVGLQTHRHPANNTPPTPGT